MPATLLSGVSSILLPPDITGPIFTKAVEQSAVMRLARRVPLSVTAQTAIPIPLDVPLADWVVEGGRKPVSSSGVNVKTMAGKKVATLIPVSEEVANNNPAALWTQLQSDLPTAISRAFDHAAIHGTTVQGEQGPFADSLGETSKFVVLGTAAAGTGGMYHDIVSGEQLVENDNWDFTGFVADPRIRTALKLSTDAYGRPLFTPDVISGTGIGDGASGSGTLDGFPIAYNRGVSGNLYRQSDAMQRTVLDGVTLSSSTSLTSATANFWAGDVGSTVTGTGIASNTTIASVTNATTVVMSKNSASAQTGISLTIAGTPDTQLRAVGGDFSQCAYGVGMDITIKRSFEASYVDTDGTTHSAFQENLVLLLAEAYYGFVVGETEAFVRYMAAGYSGS